jgi:hypothetical protein
MAAKESGKRGRKPSRRSTPSKQQEQTLSLHPITFKDALRIALNTKPPKKP